MLRSKGLSEKVIMLGIDGMDPKFSRVLVDEGKMPNLAKLIEKGSARHDLRLLGAVPTITPPMWTTLATGAYPMTHGVEDFNINIFKGELDINFSGIYSKYVHAEPLWNVTAESGKKTLVWHWPGGAWPPSSDSPNLMVVDGTSPGALGFMALARDFEFVACASTKCPEFKFYPSATTNTEHFTGDPAELPGIPSPYTSVAKKDYHDELWKEFKEGIDGFNGHKIVKYMDTRTNVLMPGDSQMAVLHRPSMNVSLSPVSEPADWGFAVPEGAKEFTIGFMYGKIAKPALVLKDENGKYNKIAIYHTKSIEQPMVVLDNNVYTKNIPDVMPQRDGSMEPIVRNMRVLNIADDASYIRIWISGGFATADDTIFYPKWIHKEISENFGPAVPTGMFGDADASIIRGCNLEQWKQAAQWQANSINYMIKNHDVEVVFSHFHGPDLAGHSYMTYLKNREWSHMDEKEVRTFHEDTYMMTDDYIGNFLPLLDEGWTIIVFSDHSLICREGDYHFIGDNYGINYGVMTELGYTVLLKDENGNVTPEIDWANTKAVQQRSNSIFINLKGRDRFGIVDPADKYEVEEQIITDLYGYKDKKTGKRVVSLALHQKDANLLGLGGEYTSGDIIFFIHDDYVHDHGESLSTAEGHNDTTVGPIFVACGAGIKEGFEMKLFPREVDVAPTAAVLLGVRIPAQCEGSPCYSILSEEL